MTEHMINEQKGANLLPEQPLLIRDVPIGDRPRERLLQVGARSLSNQEILAILLRTGSRQESVLQLAQRVLTQFDGLRLLKDASVEELCSMKGIGEAKAVELNAAMELGRRIHSMKTEERYVIRSPEDVSNYVMEDMRFLAQEHFVALYLNTKKIKSFTAKRFLSAVSMRVLFTHGRCSRKHYVARQRRSFVYTIIHLEIQPPAVRILP